MSKTKEVNKEVVEQQTEVSELEKAQQTINALKLALSESKSKEKKDINADSLLFCNSDRTEQIKRKNLSETKRFCEDNFFEYFNEKRISLKVDYLTSKDFHQIVSDLIKA